MNDGDALFRALCESPDDDTPRLVYADWLDEHGDAARAEFIRLQCERWALYATVAEARTRASALQRQHGDRWHAELPALAGVRWGDLFVRGFIDSAEISGTDDIGATLAGLFTAAPLCYLGVRGLQAGQLRTLLACPLLGRLRTLHLPGTMGRGEARLIVEVRERFPHLSID